MVEIKAKDFSNRKDIEMHIRKRLGTNAKANLDNKVAIIKGTEEELRKLGLSERVNIWGVPSQVVEEE